MTIRDIYQGIAEILIFIHYTDNIKLNNAKALLNFICDIEEIEDGEKAYIKGFFISEANEIYRSIRGYVYESIILLSFIKKMNRFIIKHYGSLDTFVNEVWDNKVPSEWESLNRDAKINTINWNIE
jgi:hypothetical protein